MTVKTLMVITGIVALVTYTAVLIATNYYAERGDYKRVAWYVHHGVRALITLCVIAGTLAIINATVTP